jgi:hypothetical protein
MSVKAICPHCNVENDPAATNCEVCKTALGAVLVGGRGTGGKFFLTSMLISIGIYMLCWLLELHPVMLLVSVFYGTLLTSYFAKNNVVWASALGGVSAIAVVIAIKIVAAFANSKGIFLAVAGGVSTADRLGDPASTGKVVVGVFVMLVAIFPVSLVGASVGEHLSVRRRLKPT